VTGELLETARAVRKAGRIRCAGVSTHQMTVAAPQLCAQSEIDVVMASCNYTASQESLSLIAALKKAGLGVASMKSMAGGPGKVNPRSAETMAAILRWVLASPVIDTAPVGMRSVEEVEANCAAAAIPFNDRDRELLERDRSLRAALYCQVCGACNGQCRMGLPVSDLVHCAMYADGYGDQPRALQVLRDLGSSAFGRGCSRCPSCTVVCPNGVAVRARVSSAQLLWSQPRVSRFRMTATPS
jgi:predicted aldo/keto reductase-like oxidoreductase